MKHKNKMSNCAHYFRVSVDVMRESRLNCKYQHDIYCTNKYYLRRVTSSVGLSSVIDLAFICKIKKLKEKIRLQIKSNTGKASS